ncbi:MAG: hypothetical protein HKN29_03165 [Rhodothermales bacterium]|nr:hypothetical protein [Rhodothermales bacterium]
MEDQEYEFGRDERLEEMYRPPFLITLVFVLTMLAIYLMGRSVSGIFPVGA